MNEVYGPLTILVVDDDEDDRLIIIRALKQSRNHVRVVSVQDGQELLDYVHRTGRYADPVRYPFPGLILLDLNMPRLSGIEALTMLKSDPRFRQIPIIILTTSDSEIDVRTAYDLGANAFIRKPVSFKEFLSALERTQNFWYKVARRPMQPR